MIELSSRERRLFKLLARPGFSIEEISRQSKREFDLQFRGYDNGYAYSAWLVLSAIYNLTDWMNSPLADMTDYCQMAKQGDWSAVRDTDKSKLWEIFNRFVYEKSLDS